MTALPVSRPDQAERKDVAGVAAELARDVTGNRIVVNTTRATVGEPGLAVPWMQRQSALWFGRRGW